MRITERKSAQEDLAVHSSPPRGVGGNTEAEQGWEGRGGSVLRKT